MESYNRSVVPLVALFLLLSGTIASAGQEKPASAWNAHDFQFRVLNTTASSGSLWICGTDEAIAVSSDDARTWDVKHHTPDGNTLLNIDFVNESFGYATGTGGIFLTTEDGGKTWRSGSVGKDTILQASFSDSQHGIIRTSSALLLTADGGQHLSVVSDGQNADDIKHFPYTFALVALDPSHMGIMLKQGSAQYEGQRFLVSSDSGKTWSITLIPDSTIYSFLRVGGQYWAVGTQVIGKDKPGGGHALASAFYSSDGEKWTRAHSDVSACQSQMCVACKKEGCFSSNGMITNVFQEKTTYSEFPSKAALTSKWSRSSSTICFVGSNLQCASLKQVDKAKDAEGPPSPVAVSPGPLGATTTTGPQCILCQMDQILIDKGAQGAFTIKLTIMIAKNGTVTDVGSDGAPTPGIKSRIEQQAKQWLFEPSVENGERVNVRLNTSVRVQVIKSQ
ncbi:MAG TPA: YCF48-related protein [Candidatus Sulfotelmatobacter sp.]|nr:YCF48-related protein [Candidatus Sulfotelmatobacter sp.]